MINVFKWELKSNLKGLFFWCLGMFLMAAMGFAEYGMVLDSGTSVAPMVDMMPRILKVMMGFGSIPIDTPEGWYACMYLWLAIIAFTHSAMLGASIISKEERDKTSEFIFTRPLKRSDIITAKILVAVKNAFILNLVAFITGEVVLWEYIKGTDLPEKIALTMVGMFITQMVFLGIGLFLSAVFEEKGKAGLYAAILVLGTYFAYVFIEMVGDVDFLGFLSPFRYFNVADVLVDGLQWFYVLIAAVIIAVTGYFTYFLFGKRNLHS